MNKKQPIKPKRLKYLHYYPQFLIKKWGTFIKFYDFNSKEFSTINLSRKKVGSFHAPNKKIEEAFYEIEQKYNTDAIFKGQEIENEMANLLKEVDSGSFSLKKYKPGSIVKFVESILIKAPNFRASKHLYSSLGNYGKNEMKKDKFLDSMVVTMKELYGSKNKERVQQILNKLNENQEVMIVRTGIGIPFFDPGYNLFSISGECSFIMQVSPMSFMVWTNQKGVKFIEDFVNKYTDKPGNIVDLMVRYLLEGNPLLYGIYYSENIYKNFELEENIKIMQEEFNKMEKEKNIGAIFFITKDPEWTIPISINGIERTLIINSKEKTSIFKSVIYSSEFKKILSGYSLELRNLTIKIKEYQKMEILKGKRLILKNSTLWIE